MFSGSKGRAADPGRSYCDPLRAGPFFKQRCALSLPGAFVFMNPRVNKPYTANALKRLWQEMRAKAGLSRSSAFTTPAALGSDPAPPGRRVPPGHQGPARPHRHPTTMKYAHGDIEKLRTNLERLSLRKVEKLERTQTGPDRPWKKKLINYLIFSNSLLLWTRVRLPPPPPFFFNKKGGYENNPLFYWSGSGLAKFGA